MDTNDHGGAAILVVDDDPQLLELTKTILEECGYTVFSANDGERALELLELHNTVDLVITDIMMPGKEGVGLIRAIRGKDKTIKVIAMSGMINDETVLHTAKVFGADAAFKKPFKIDELINKVDSLIFERTGLRRTEAAGNDAARIVH